MNTFVKYIKCDHDFSSSPLIRNAKERSNMLKKYCFQNSVLWRYVVQALLLDSFLPISDG